MIELFEAINERAALNSDAAVVFYDACVGFNHLRGEIEGETNLITGGPPATERKIARRGFVHDGLVIHEDVGGAAPGGDTKINCEFRG